MLATSVHPKAALPLQDLAVLTELQAQLLKLLAANPSEATTHTVSNTYTDTGDKGKLRIAVLNRRIITSLKKLYFVGFFGQKKQFIQPALSEQVSRFDDLLTRDLAHYPTILSYSSIQLADHYNYGNLVIFSQPQDIEHWKENHNHKQASGEISRGYYDTIRIHTGLLEGGLNSNFQLQRTSFYDFRAGSANMVSRKLY
jgi:hypothetical protein